MPIDYSKWDNLASSDEEDVTRQRAPGVTKVAEPDSPVEDLQAAALEPLPSPCYEFLESLGSIPYATSAAEALRTGTPVVIQGACGDWPATRLWTWELFASRYGSAEVTVGDWRAEFRRRRRLRKLLEIWWPEESLPADGSTALGCHRWRALDDFPELCEQVRLSVPGVKELGSSMSGKSQQSSSAGRWSPSRTSLTMGQAGYVARPLRQVSFGRHCWLACVRGAIRCFVVPSKGRGLRQESCEAHWTREDSKGRRQWDFDPLRPDFAPLPEDCSAEGQVCNLTEGEILVVPSGCLLWTEHLWSSLAVHHAFVTQQNMMQFQQWSLHHKMNNGQ